MSPRSFLFFKLWKLKLSSSSSSSCFTCHRGLTVSNKIQCGNLILFVGWELFQSIWKISERVEFIIHVKIAQTIPGKRPIIRPTPALSSLPVRGATKKVWDKRRQNLLVLVISVNQYRTNAFKCEALRWARIWRCSGLHLICYKYDNVV